jgi:hypothetical protein
VDSILGLNHLASPKSRLFCIDKRSTECIITTNRLFTLFGKERVILRLSMYLPDQRIIKSKIIAEDYDTICFHSLQKGERVILSPTTCSTYWYFSYYIILQIMCSWSCLYEHWNEKFVNMKTYNSGNRWTCTSIMFESQFR